MTRPQGYIVTPATEVHSGKPICGSQFLCADEVRGKENTVEYLAVLLQQESKLYPPCDDYLSERHASLLSSNDTDSVSESWRRKLCEWCYQVVDHFNFDREAVSIALHYLDRSVSKWTKHSHDPIPKREFQLLAVTSLYMAIKIHGETDCAVSPRRKLKIDAFYELSRKQFDVEVIERTEMQILVALNWNVNPPTALKFIVAFLNLCPKWQHTGLHALSSSVLGGIYDVARYLAELSVCQSDFSFHCKTSVLAYASILFSIEALHSTLQLPYAVRVSFLSNIAEATGFVSGHPEVLRVCHMFKRLCPDMFNVDEISSDNASGAQKIAGIREDVSIDGKASPVCVIDAHQDQGARRKRSRSSSENSWSPIHRPGE